MTSSTKGKPNEDGLLQSNDQWALLPPDPDQSLDPDHRGKPTLTYFMPWIAEQDMPATLASCCRALDSAPPDWPGVKLFFVEKPSPGFVLRITKGWEPANTAQEQALFKKILWEIQRIERS